jgi:hypothetical protein
MSQNQSNQSWEHVAAGEAPDRVLYLDTSTCCSNLANVGFIGGSTDGTSFMFRQRSS